MWEHVQAEYDHGHTVQSEQESVHSVLQDILKKSLLVLAVDNSILISGHQKPKTICFF